MGQENRDSLQIKTEQVECRISPENEQRGLKHEDDLSGSNASCEKYDDSEVWPLGLESDQHASEEENELSDDISTESFGSDSDSESSGGSELSSDHPPPLFDTPFLANNQAHESDDHGNAANPARTSENDSASMDNVDAELKPEQDERQHAERSQGNTISTINCQAKPHDKPFKCNCCNKDFNFHRQLQNHMRIHTAERPFKCTVCERRFLLSHHLKSHMISHSAERPFSCSKCWRTFRRLHNLKEHMTIHDKPHYCRTCKKTFSHETSLEVHERSHSNQKPYSCESCRRKFNSQIALKSHIMNIHTGKKLSLVHSSV